MNELKDKYGISYNKSDLSTVRATIAQIKKDNDKRLKEEGIEENDVELPSVQKQLVETFKANLYAEVDLIRARKDLNDLVGNDDTSIERTKRKINKWKRVQKENIELEQDVEDNYRQTERKEDTVPIEDEIPVTTPNQAQPSQSESVEVESTESETTEEEPVVSTTDVEPTSENKIETVETEEENTKEEDKSTINESEPTVSNTSNDSEINALKEELNTRRKQIEEARTAIKKVTVEQGHKGRSSIEKTRDKLNAARITEGKELASYTDADLNEVPKAVYNPQNKYGKEYQDYKNFLDTTLKNIDTDVASIMVGLHPESEWKYRNERDPYFIMQDVNELSDMELSLPVSNLLDTKIDYNSFLSNLEEAISDVDTEAADIILDKLNDARRSVENSLQAYQKSVKDKEDAEVDVATLDTFSQKGHRIVSDNSPEFTAYSAKSDFITGSTYTLTTKNNDVYVTFHYKGKDISTRMLPDSQSSALVQKINAYLSMQKKDPSLVIGLTGVDRTNGIIINGSYKKLTDTEIWEGSKDPYDITPDNTVISIGTGAYGNTSRRGNQTFFQRNTSMGGIYWQANLFRPETGKKSRLSIKLTPAKLGEFEGLSEFVLDVINQIDQPKFTTKDGKQTPFSPQDLLDFIVFNGKDSQVRENQTDSYNQEQFDNRKAKQLYFNDNGQLVIGNNAYDLTDLNSNQIVRKQAAEQLNDFNFRIIENNLYENWGSDNLKEGNIFKGLKSYFYLRDIDKLTLVPGAIEFDKEMLGLGSNPKHKRGISTLGYYISKGLIKSDFEELVDARVYFKDVVINKPAEPTTGTTQVENQITNDVESEIDIAESIFDGLIDREIPMAFFTSKDLEKRTETQMKAARKIVAKLTDLSEDDIETQTDILGVTQSGLYILGKAKVDSITLSERMPEGVEYHEAWHRISNLLM